MRSLAACIRMVTPSFLHVHLDRLQASPLRWRLARGFFWSLAGAVISRGLSLPASIIVARLLGREGFGEIGIINGTVGMFGVFAGFGLGLTATKYTAEFRVNEPARAGRIISLSGITALFTGGLMAALLFILAPWLAERTLAAPHLSSMLRITTVSLLFGALNGAQTGALAGFEAFKTIARVNVITGIASFPLMVGGAYLAGVRGAVWGMAIGTVVNWLLNHIAIRSELRRFRIPLMVSGVWREARILYSFSVPSVLSGALVGPVNWFCFAMLVNQTNGYAEMGIFNAANQWRTALLFLPNIVGSVVLPILSSLTSANDKEAYKKILLENVLINAIIVFVAAIVITFLAPTILAFYGADFVEGKYALILLCFAAVLMAVNNVIGQGIASIGKMWKGLVFNLLWAAVLLLCAYYLLGSDYGASGLALAILVSYVMHTCWQGIYIYRWVQSES